MLVHICCSVDSHYFLTELKKQYPDEEMIGFFYNPNIHPKAEYDLRLLDVKRSCEILGIRLFEGQYDDQEWCHHVRGLEDEPEKGDRCNVCFDVRLLESAKFACQLKETRFTTTLLASPMKTQQILFAQGDEIARKYGLKFVKIDVRSNGGTQKQNEMSKQENLYRQNYCGCKFALQKQREKQERFPLEFISSINKQMIPGSIEYRNEIFSKRNQFEQEQKPYFLFQQTQIVWRCLNAKLEDFIETIPFHVLAHSSSKNNIRLGNLFWNVPLHLKHILKKGKIGYSKRDDTLLLTLDALNELLQFLQKNPYKTLQELLHSPLPYDIELQIRGFVTHFQSLCPILIVKKEIQTQLRLNITSLFQEEKVFEIIEF